MAYQNDEVTTCQVINRFLRGQTGIKINGFKGNQVADLMNAVYANLLISHRQSFLGWIASLSEIESKDLRAIMGSLKTHEEDAWLNGREENKWRPVLLFLIFMRFYMENRRAWSGWGELELDNWADTAVVVVLDCYKLSPVGASDWEELVAALGHDRVERNGAGHLFMTLAACALIGGLTCLYMRR